MIPQDAIGVKDFTDRELLLVKDLNNTSGMNNLCVILNKRGDLELQQIQEVTPIIIQQEPAFLFKTLWDKSPFSLKASGRTYFGKEDNRYSTTYKMDYDNYGNMLVTPVFGGNSSRPSGPQPIQLFMTKLQVFMVRRKRDQLRQNNKERRRNEEDKSTSN